MFSLSGHDRKRSIWVNRRSGDEDLFPTNGTPDNEGRRFVLRSQLAVYRDEIRRLHYANDTLTESVQVMQDAMKFMEMNHTAEIRQLKEDLAPGFVWPDRDRSAKAARLEAELASVTAERDRLLARYESRNLAKKSGYAETRSNVSRDMKRELEELPVDETATDTLPKKIGPPAGHEGSSHSNRPVRRHRHVITRCGKCGGRRVGQGRLRVKLVNDFDGDRIAICTHAHMGRSAVCMDCGHVTKPEFPGTPGTSFGGKALGFIVHFSGRKNVDDDIASYFEEMFHFKAAGNAIWNARKAASDILEPTLEYIMEELKTAPFLGIDETYYSVNGRKGYVWVVRTDRAVFILALPTRAGAVLPAYFRELLDKPVVVDGYSAYATYFRVIQRCWSHILGAAEEAYVRERRREVRKVYYSLYRRLQGIFHEAKKLADSGGADVDTCLAMERRVLELAAMYGDHGFGTTLTNAAPNLFTFLRHPGMPPTNNATEQDIRDGIVLQRNIRHKFVNAKGMHVFSVLQSFNRTCRKLGLIPWKCVERIVKDPDYSIFEAGSEAAGAAPAPGAGHEPDALYVDQIRVPHPTAEWNEAEIRKFLARLSAAQQVQPPAPPPTPEEREGSRGAERPDPAPRAQAQPAHTGEADGAVAERPDPAQPPSDGSQVLQDRRTHVPPPSDDTDLSHVPFHGKPPPAAFA